MCVPSWKPILEKAPYSNAVHCGTGQSNFGLPQSGEIPQTVDFYSQA